MGLMTEMLAPLSAMLYSFSWVTAMEYARGVEGDLKWTFLYCLGGEMDRLNLLPRRLWEDGGCGRCTVGC